MPDEQEGTNQTGKGMIVTGMPFKFKNCIKGKTEAAKYE
jgi:hypothetical protein